MLTIRKTFDPLFQSHFLRQEITNRWEFKFTLFEKTRLIQKRNENSVRMLRMNQSLPFQLDRMWVKNLFLKESCLRECLILRYQTTKINSVMNQYSWLTNMRVIIEGLQTLPIEFQHQLFKETTKSEKALFQRTKSRR